MTIRLFADETACAIYEEAPGGGDPTNPAALMNRPFLNPMAWVANILFHSDFNYYGVAAMTLGTAVAHEAVAGYVNIRPVHGTPVEHQGQSVVRSHVLLNHNLGYVPLFFVAYDGQMIPHGTPTQVEAGGFRLVSAYATTTQILIRDLGISSASALPAASRTYQALAFRSTAKNPALPMLDLTPGAAVFGQGKFQQGQAHLRKVLSGETPFSIALGRTAAIRNGGLQVRMPNGNVVNFGPFNGTLPAPPVINLTVGG